MLLPNRQGSNQNKKRKMLNNCNSTSLANPTMVHSSVKHVYTEPNFVAPGKKLVNKSSRGNPPPSPKVSINTSGLDHIRESLSTTGLSEQAVELISSNRRNSTISNYELAWRKFCGWCSEQQTDPFRCDLKFVINYLVDLFCQGYKYHT